MATPFRLKRSSVASKRPGLTDLQKGELALNFYDGHLFAERDTAGVGIGTTIANLTPWKETFGGTAINYENSVGIGSTNPTGRLDVSGLTVLDEVKISGVTTFTSDVDLNAGLDVDGAANLDELSVTGVATFTNGIECSGAQMNVTAGFVANSARVSDLTDNRVVIVGGSGELEDDANLTFNGTTLAVGTRLEVDGATDLDELAVAGVSTFNGQVGFNTHVDISDHSKLRFGDGDDLQIWHQGSNSIVQNSTGELQLRGNTIRLLNAATTKDYAFFNNDGSVDLYYDDSKKFSTTGVGVSILNGIGATFATISAPAELIIDPAAVGDNTGLVRIKGDLYVDGTEFIVDSETIKLADHVVGIASTSTTDALTDGAGIGIGTNKFFTFDNSNTAFKSTENINLESGHSYKIDGSDALSADTLGAGVINSSLVNLGTLTHLTVTGVTTSTGGFRAGAGGTTFTTKSGRVGINTSQASEEHMLEVYGNINIVGDDVEYYQNGQRRTAGVGIHSRGTAVAGLGATIIDFVGTGVSSIIFNSAVGIATVNIAKTTFSRDTTSFTATSGQTSFALSYTPGFIDVYVNGVRLTASEFTATNGSSVVLNTGAFTGDIVDITAFTDDGFAAGGKWSPQDGTPANIFYSTGNVGIHSVSPKVTLDVIGEARISGVVTAGAYLVGGNQVISSARQLQNIASLDSTTTATIESAIANTPNTFTDLKISGISTLGTVLISSGIITATTASGVVTYFGDGSGLTGVASTDNIITTTDAQFDASVGIADTIFHIGDTNTKLRFPANDTFTVETDATERFRVTSVGLIGIGTADPDNFNANADDLVIYGNGHQGLTIRSGTAHDGSIMFNDTNDTNQRGIIRYDHTTDALRFHTSNGELVSLDGTKVGIGTTNPKGDVDIGEQFSIKTTTTAVSSTAATTIDTLAIATYRSSRFQVQITQGTDYQSADLMVIHDGTTASIIEYGSIATNNMLASFTSTISGSNLLLQANMGSSTSATVKVVRYGISV